MSKRLIEIDDELLDRARNTLGTSGIRETVIAALERASSGETADERAARIHRLGVAAAHATRDALDDEVMRGARY